MNADLWTQRTQRLRRRRKKLKVNLKFGFTFASFASFAKPLRLLRPEVPTSILQIA